jgi:hypothetical protein
MSTSTEEGATIVRSDLFADGIANVSMANGVIRIDFYVARPTAQRTNGAGAIETEREVHLSVNLPLPTFVSSMNVLQRLIGQLVERGVVTAARPPGQEPAPPS